MSNSYYSLYVTSNIDIIIDNDIFVHATISILFLKKKKSNYCNLDEVISLEDQIVLNFGPLYTIDSYILYLYQVPNVVLAQTII